MIQAIGLTSLPRRHQLKPAVDDLTFEARPGRVTVLLGAEGSGKSTALRLMLQLQAGRGTALFRGRPVERIVHLAREVGVLLGEVHGHPGRTARGHLRMLAAAAGVPAGRADDVLDVVGLSGLADQRMGTLSRGMDRRMGIACALLGDPHTLVLDEPAHDLSPRETIWLYSLLRGYARQGGTALVTSHRSEEAAQLADRVVSIDSGRLVADQEAADFVRTRLRPRVAVRTPYADRLVAVLTQEGRKTGRDRDRGPLKAVLESGTRVSVYGSSCAEVGELAHRNGILVHQLSDERGDAGDACTPGPLDRADGRRTGRLTPGAAVTRRGRDGAAGDDREPEPKTAPDGNAAPGSSAAEPAEDVFGPVAEAPETDATPAERPATEQVLLELEEFEKLETLEVHDGTRKEAPREKAPREKESWEEEPREGAPAVSAEATKEGTASTASAGTSGSDSLALTAGSTSGPEPSAAGTSPPAYALATEPGPDAGPGVPTSSEAVLVTSPASAPPPSNPTTAAASPAQAPAPNSQTAATGTTAPASTPANAPDAPADPAATPSEAPTIRISDAPLASTGSASSTAPTNPLTDSARSTRSTGATNPPTGSASSTDSTNPPTGSAPSTDCTGSADFTDAAASSFDPPESSSDASPPPSAPLRLKPLADPDAPRRPKPPWSPKPRQARAAADLPPPLGAVGRPGPAAPLRYELYRLASLRGTWISVAVTVAVALCISLVMALTGLGMPSVPSGSDGSPSPLVRLLMGWPSGGVSLLPPAAVAAGLLGAFAFGEEFRYPALAPARAPVPRRLSLLAAKLAVSAVLAVLLAAAVAVTNAAAVSLFFGAEVLEPPSGTAGLWRLHIVAVVGLATGCAWSGVLAAGIFRSGVLGTAVVVAVPLLLAPVARTFLGDAPGTGHSADGLPGRLEAVLLVPWPPGTERWAAAFLELASQPVGCALALSLVVLSAGYLAIALSRRAG